MDLKILEIAANTENHKVVKNHTHSSKNKNPICGDEMEIRLLVKNDLIEDIGYQCKSCVYCQASVSLLSRNVIDKTINNLEVLFQVVENFFTENPSNFPKEWKIFEQVFDKKNILRKECILLPFKTLSKALKL